MNLITLVIVSTFSISGASAQLFDETRCGIQYPKTPENVSTAPTQVFQSTDTYGIKSTLYPLICRSGSPMSIEQRLFFPTTAEAPTSSGQSLFFKRAPIAGGVTGENLKPGECAWILGPVNESERYELKDSTIYRFPTLKLTTKNTTAGMTKEMTIEPNVFEPLIKSSYVVVFYVRSLGWTIEPFCVQTQLGIRGQPYLILKQ